MKRGLGFFFFCEISCNKKNIMICDFHFFKEMQHHLGFCQEKAESEW